MKAVYGFISFMILRSRNIKSIPLRMDILYTIIKWRRLFKGSTLFHFISFIFAMELIKYVTWTQKHLSLFWGGSVPPDYYLRIFYWVCASSKAVPRYSISWIYLVPFCSSSMPFPWKPILLLRLIPFGVSLPLLELLIQTRIKNKNHRQILFIQIGSFPGFITGYLPFNFGTKSFQKLISVTFYPLALR